MSVLRVERLTYTYPGAGAPALRDVSLALEPGEFCVLAGMSGSGKSTLLRAAAGLVPHFHGGAFAGTVRVVGMDTREHSPAQIATGAGTLLQDPETQIVMSSVRSELACALENRGESPLAIARAVEETSLALGIAHLLDRHTAELSGGELQRVALACALITRPALLLLDEPTSQLDPVAGDELIWQLHRLNQEADTAVLLIEHRLERCLAAADRVIALADGAIACDSDPRGFLQWAGDHEPALQTPGARLFAAAGIAPPPAGVKQARSRLRALALLAQQPEPAASPQPARTTRQPVLSLRGLWHEIRDGPAILRGIDLELRPGEAVALIGRNGAGKSTLLRHMAGLLEPTRGKLARAGRVALLLQNPGDYFLHERVEQEASREALESAGLTALAARHPRELSGGERQRLALAIVLGAGEPAQVVALDEPTRGMDRAAKEALAAWVSSRALAGSAVVVATHDCEFAAQFATRVVLLADGRILADGSPAQLLSGGWYFSTETARILGGAAGALRAEDGAALLRGRRRDAELLLR